MRIEDKCCGDCCSCELLISGKVDMIPCVLDQIFQRVQKQEAQIMAIEKSINSEKNMALASIEPSLEIKDKEL